VIPARHVARIGSIEMAGTGEPTQHPSPHLLLHCGEILWPQRGGLGGPHPQPLSHFAGEGSQVDLPVCTGNEHPVDHRAVEVDMRIQRAAEALHETHRPHSPAGDGRAGAFFVGDRLAHSNKIPLILPIV
jgi:hypothetical protein